MNSLCFNLYEDQYYSNLQRQLAPGFVLILTHFFNSEQNVVIEELEKINFSKNFKIYKDPMSFRLYTFGIDEKVLFFATREDYEKAKQMI